MEQIPAHKRESAIRAIIMENRRKKGIDPVRQPITAKEYGDAERLLAKGHKAPPLRDVRKQEKRPRRHV